MNRIRSTETNNVTQTVLKETKWVYLSSFLSNALRPLFAIVLARLLLPSDFGLIAYTMIFMSCVKLIQDIGLKQALIQWKDEIGKASDVAFAINIALGVVWFATTFVAAPFVSVFFDEPQIVHVLRVMAVSFLITPFGAVQNTLLSKRLSFKKLFYLNLIPAVVPGILSVVMALLGYGVWSIVYGSLLGSIFNVLVVWKTVPWRPGLTFDMSIAGRMLKFGGAVSAEGILSWLVNTLDDILVGKWLGSSALGFYTVGFNVSIAPAKYISSPLINIIFPALSKLQENKKEVRDAFLKVMKYVSLITLPFGVGLAVTASIFVPVLLGEKWMPAVPVIQIISLYGIFMSLGSILPQVYKALGRPEIYLTYVAVRTAVAVPVYFNVVPYGLTAISMAHLVLSGIFFPVNFFIGMRVMEIPPRMVFDSFWVPIVCVAGLALFAIVLKEGLIGYVDSNSLLSLGIVVAGMMLFYAGLLFVVNRKTFFELKGLLMKIIGR